MEWALRAGIATELGDFDCLDKPPALARGLVFLPAFSGLGAPHWDRSAAPLLIGLTPEMTRHDICQALLEGIAFLTADLVAEIAKAAPSSGPIWIDGGLSASAAFTTFLAQVCQRDVAVSALGERTAFGAAQLAALALGASLQEPEGRPAIVSPGPAVPEWQTRFNAAMNRARDWHAD